MFIARYPNLNYSILKPLHLNSAGEVSDGATQLELTFSTGGTAATEANTFICGDTILDMKSILIISQCTKFSMSSSGGGVAWPGLYLVYGYVAEIFWDEGEILHQWKR